MDSPVNTEMPNVAVVLDRAIQDHQAGRIAAAETGYHGILAQDPGQPDAWHLLGMLACDRGDIPTAIRLIDTAINLQADRAAFHNTRARALTLSGDLAEAEAAYRTAWSLRPDTAEIANNLGCLLRDRGDLEGAEQWLCRARTLAPSSGKVVANLADVLAARGSLADSLMLFQQAVLLAPDAFDIHHNLGRALFSIGRLSEAEQSYRTALRLRPDHAPIHNNLGLVLQAQGHAGAALQYFKEAVRHDPSCADAHYNLGCLLLLDNRLDEARDCQDRAIQAAPLHGAALWARCMAELPVAYETPAQIPLQRTRYAQQLNALATKADEPAVARALAAAIGASQPFFLPYQGQCDRALQTIYGQLVARVLHIARPPAGFHEEIAASFEAVHQPSQVMTKWDHATKTEATSPPRALTEPWTLADLPATDDRIRIGIVSGYFCEHTIWRLMLKGWLSQFDRARFSIHAYHTGSIQDDQTVLARRMCEQFTGGPGTDLRATILHHRPHVLLYPELGMDPGAVRLAGERLAPVQCVSWGQPETSGLPTMDCFLSSALMEPGEAASHYSEPLVTLPNLGIYYTPDERQAEPCTRSALGLREAAIVFWCGQALYKYLPQYDDIFARIAVAVGDCQFLFIGFAKSATVTECLRSRLRSAFAARGLDADRYCVFLAPMSQERFLGTVRLADIMLDSIGWSGGKSTLDALAEAPIIVTHAGSLMRGRHTMAILTGIGVTETIAATIDDYVAIAVRLAHDPAERMALRARVTAGRHRVMADTAPIRALEEFLTEAVTQASLAAGVTLRPIRVGLRRGG